MMSTKCLWIVGARLAFASLGMLAMVPCIAAQRAPAPAQPYAGQDTRAVSTLSAADVQALREGRGWGLAKPAELNGYPGPMHVLELAEKLELTEPQKKRVELIFKRMKLGAISIGTRYVEAERAIDNVFKEGAAQTGGLQTRLRDAERLRSELRRAHLQAHVETTPVLTPEQRKKYSELRGYGVGSDQDMQLHGPHKH